VKIHPIGSVSQGAEGKTIAEMMEMHTAGALAFSDGWTPINHSGFLLKALEYVKGIEAVIIQIPEDVHLSKGGLMNEGALSTRLGMMGKPAIAETISIKRDLDILAYTGSKLHITGISTRTSVALIREAKAAGLNVTCSVTPYHLLLTEDNLVGYDSNYKVTPPLRSEDDRQALIEGLQDGTIDAIYSHHKPQDWDGKHKEFEYAAEGMNLQQYVYALLNDQLGNVLPQEVLVNVLSYNTRQLLGLPTELNIGDKVDLTVFSPSMETVISTQTQLSKSSNNPFLGTQVNGAVVALIHS
jgi:dihydroorotase